MATSPSTPNSTNTYIRSYEDSGRLLVGFAKNAEKFTVNKYCKQVTVPKQEGYWAKYLNQNSGRIINHTRSHWADGMESPPPTINESFLWKTFKTERRAYAYRIGKLADEMAELPLRKVEQQIRAAQAMTERTMLAMSELTTAANWQTTADADLSAHHTSTAAALVGGTLEGGTATDPLIRNAFNKIASIITKDTMGAVENDPGAFIIVIQPDDAVKLGSSPELVEYLKSSPAAYAQITGNLHPNARYGLPETLYGYPLVIESTVKVTNDPGGTLARSYALTAGNILMLSRPGGLEGAYLEGSFATLTMFAYEDMTVEENVDSYNRLIEGRVTCDYDMVLTCPASGYLLTSAVA